MKKIIPAILAGVILFTPSVIYAEEGLSETKLETPQLEDISEMQTGQETQRISDSLGRSLTGAALGNNYSSDEIADFLEKDGQAEEAKAMKDLNVSASDFSTGLTDKWITTMLEQANGKFGGFDTSEFVTFDTDSSNLLNAKYKLTLNNLAENGWGQMPTDGVFSNANGFEGYTITADSGASNAAELFGKEYSEILDSMNNGTFMQSLDDFKQDMDVNKAKENVGFNSLQSTGVEAMGSLNNMDQMRAMIDSFGSELNKEKSDFASSQLYNAASAGLKSVDVQSGINAYYDTPTTISAAFVAGQLEGLKGSVDSGAISNYNSIKGSLSSAASATKALNGVVGRDANGLADINGAAKSNYDNAINMVKNEVNLQGYKDLQSNTINAVNNPGGLAANAFNTSVIGNIAGFFGFKDKFNEWLSYEENGVQDIMLQQGGRDLLGKGENTISPGNTKNRSAIDNTGDALKSAVVSQPQKAATGFTNGFLKGVMKFGGGMGMAGSKILEGAEKLN